MFLRVSPTFCWQISKLLTIGFRQCHAGLDSFTCYGHFMLGGAVCEESLFIILTFWDSFSDFYRFFRVLSREIWVGRIPRLPATRGNFPPGDNGLDVFMGI